MAWPAAIGFRAHSGWAAAVALVRVGDGLPAVAARRRIEMMERGSVGPSQPYHAAVGLDLDEAEQLVSQSAALAASLAWKGLRGAIEHLEQLGHGVAGCGLLLASGRALPPLKSILASHALIHTAEGELFREALRSACRKCGLPLTEIKERELMAQATGALKLPAGRIEGHLAAMGKSAGPPWRQDEKFAALAAWIALPAV